MDEKKPADCVITIVDSCSDLEQPVPARTVTSTPFRNAAFTLSNHLFDWTPFLLVVFYFVFSTSVYTICNDGLKGIFWFIYMTTNFYVAGSTVIEAIMSRRAVREAIQAVQEAENREWKFATSDQELPRIDLVLVA